MAAGIPTGADEAFAQRLFARLLAATREHVPATGSGFDPKRAWRLTHRDRAKDFLLSGLARAGFARRGYDPAHAARFLSRLAPLLPGLGATERAKDEHIHQQLA